MVFKRLLLSLSYFLAFGISFLAVFLPRFKRFPLERWDESYYIRLAVTKSLDPSWAPIYSLWYRFLGIFCHDTIALYRVSHEIIFLSIAVLTFLLICSRGAPALIGIFASLTLFCWSKWTTEANLVNHFDLLCFLLALYLVDSFIAKLQTRLFWLGVVSLALCYVRQDNLIIAIGFFLVAGAMQIKEGIRCIQFRKYILATIAIFFILNLFYQLNPFSESKSWQAFADFYSLNCGVKKYGRDELMSAVFHGAHSVLGSIVANPRAFFSHVCINWSIYAEGIKYLPLQFEGVALLGLLFVASILVISGKLQFTNERSFELGILALLLGLRAAESISVFTPMFRYYSEFFVVVWIWFLSGIRVPIRSHWSISFAPFVMMSVFYFGAFSTNNWLKRFSENRILFTEMIEKMRAIPHEQRRSWFANPGFPLFLSDPRAQVEFVFWFEKKTTTKAIDELANSVKRQHLDVIVLSMDDMMSLRLVLGEAGSAQFVKRIITPCYRLWDSGEYGPVYLRNASCTLD